MTEEDCLFCGFASGRMKCDVVVETDTTLAFRDINPQAPTHVLVIPRQHHPNVAALAAHAPELLSDLLGTVGEIVRREGLEEHYRLVFNTGADAGQSVFHVHGHVLGGRPLGWPPG